MHTDPAEVKRLQALQGIGAELGVLVLIMVCIAVILGEILHELKRKP
jgi:hypothetical protein